MSARQAIAEWNGALVTGSGTIELATSGQGQFPYSLPARAADAATMTSPEELLAAAYASCYAMQLAALLDAGPDDPVGLHGEVVGTQGGPEVDFGIADVALTVRGRGIGRSAEEFVGLAQQAAQVCPVGRALAAVPKTVDAALQS